MAHLSTAADFTIRQRIDHLGRRNHPDLDILLQIQSTILQPCPQQVIVLGKRIHAAQHQLAPGSRSSSALRPVARSGLVCGIQEWVRIPSDL